MAIVIEGITSTSSAAANNIDVTYPAGIESGDLLVIGLASDGQAADPDANGDIAASGFIINAYDWTPSSSDQTALAMQCLFKRAAGTESGTVNVTCGGSNELTAWMARISGVFGSTVSDCIEVAPTYDEAATSTTVQQAGATTLSNGAVAIGFICVDASRTISAGPNAGAATGWTGELLDDTVAGQAPSVAVCSKQVDSAATGIYEYTLATADEAGKGVFVIKSSAGSNTTIIVPTGPLR